MYIKIDKTVIDGKEYTFRLINSKDGRALGDFFLSLSDNIKRKYSPHPFDRKTARDICKGKDKKCKRVVAVCDGAIVGYCIVYFKLRKWEKMRYDKAGMFLTDDVVCTMAPCVRDAFQHLGIGTEMFKYVVKVTKAYKKKIIILWGGVVLKNYPAVNYYKKIGFKILKKWLHPILKCMCYDMYIEV